MKVLSLKLLEKSNVKEKDSVYCQFEKDFVMSEDDEKLRDLYMRVLDKKKGPILSKVSEGIGT